MMSKAEKLKPSCSEKYPESMEHKFQFYKDPECRTPLGRIQFPDPVMRGHEKAELIVYAKNMTKEEFDSLQFESVDPEVKIEKSDDKVMSLGTIMLKFIFTPSENRNNALNTEMKICGRAIIRG